ncbi:hypothetical protein A3C87_00095 [Candidatus Kaiserbacteria bacterium RIFCSPHIGHO2_02_FULL_49_34]|uniref:PepSY domain-containing protein n=1 Tax=Candidatus Kaiserbacteria bacterium RIFCSPHIGHO2_02_FULL_49_34 TaxID=1798491 RepID=A0A1F6DIV7_9BACT|nr:MAG: hypothetical protein A3C87_00095 [Candidatus Kaiserbacteria bacterium RIFCSPHIGHO2_02_FULL_49_34]
MKKEASKITYESVDPKKGGSFTVPWVIAAIFALGVLGYAVWQYGPVSEDLYEEPQVLLEASLSAYDAALLVATKAAQSWQSNAVVASFEPLEESNARGDARGWRFVFTSTSKRGTGYVVDVKNGVVVSHQEGAVGSVGTILPQNAKTIDEAIAEVHAMPGRENAIIEGVEALVTEGVWYWGVRTDKGTISIKMEK